MHTKTTQSQNVKNERKRGEKENQKYSMRLEERSLNYDHRLKGVVRRNNHDFKR